MSTKLLLHGSGHRAASWDETISHLSDTRDLLRPDLSAILGGRAASYGNLYAALVAYCGRLSGPIHLCGLSLGGILALHYCLDFPERVKTLVLIGTPHKIPKAALGLQNVLFRLIPKSAFQTMAFDKADTFALGRSMRELDFSDSVKRIQCPTLIICGEKDRANLKSAYFLARHIRGAELKLVKNTGHVVNEESPKALAALLDAFYAGE